jgi:glutathione S-transferase
MSTLPLRLVGAPGSPYSRKMRALLRYRRIPFHFVIRNSKDDRGTPSVPVALIPILVLPSEAGEDEGMIDSTFQIRRLEHLYAERKVVPEDPGLALFDALIEDYADEWVTKCMFHYRWAFDADIEKASQVLPRWSEVTLPDEAIDKLSKLFAERQIGRLGVVGSNPTTGPFIEDSYRRLLAALEAHFGHQRFVLGDRPAAADFGLFGQLTQLVWFDPTPTAVSQAFPRVLAWMDLMEDLSGLEPGDWLTRDQPAESLHGLLAEIGRVSPPFLLGNAAALESGAEQVDCVIDGRKWVQKPFPYQGKCLTWLRERHAGLAADDRKFVDGALAGTGCEALFAS